MFFCEKDVKKTKKKKKKKKLKKKLLTGFKNTQISILCLHLLLIRQAHNHIKPLAKFCKRGVPISMFSLVFFSPPLLLFVWGGRKTKKTATTHTLRGVLRFNTPYFAHCSLQSLHRCVYKNGKPKKISFIVFLRKRCKRN